MSDIPPKKAQKNLNFVIYDTKEMKCDPNSNEPISGCVALQRLNVSEAYYVRLDVHKSKDGQEIFLRFIKDIYPFCLEDYQHLMNLHVNNLEEITGALKKSKLLRACGDVRKCAFTKRHHSRERSKLSSTSSMDRILLFYCHIMDAVHFYTQHLYDCGMRIKAAANNSNDNEDDGGDKYYDAQMSRIAREIKEKEHIRGSFARLKSGNNKFSMFTTTAAAATETIYLDELIKYLLSCNIKESTLKKFAAFINLQDYDTESSKRDIENQVKCNIFDNIYDKEAVKAIGEFVKATKIRSSSFNVGLTFYYWPKYQNMETFEQNTNMENINDHAGYKISDLFIKKRYSTFKEEISHYTFINMEAYQETMVKVQEYLNTDAVKQMKAFNESGYSNYNIVLFYGIAHGSVLLPRHLLSLCLYTDFTKLCTHFSATFRAIKQFEPLSSIKARNAKYFWMSKCLRETVQLFGVRRKFGNLSGPFYSGISLIMPFPEFQVRLCGPTSTSKAIAVAINFAGQNGCVVQLNNNIRNSHNYLPSFSCGWLSDFSEEAEFLFIGGHHRIKIESVRILNGKDGKYQNFEQYFSALGKFNKMFNGSHAANKYENKVTEDDKMIISALFNWILGKQALSDNIDGYVVDTFLSFAQEKQHIAFNYYDLCKYNNTFLRDMIFYGMRTGSDFKPGKESKINIFRKEIFQMFTNIKNIDIYTTLYNGNPSTQSALSVEELLNEIKQENWNQVTVKGVHEYNRQTKEKRKASWLSFLWQSSANKLKETSKTKGFEISFKNEKNADNYDVDCLVIQKV